MRHHPQPSIVGLAGLLALALAGSQAARGQEKGAPGRGAADRPGSSA